MTPEELSQLYYLNREIEMDKRRLQELEAKALPGAQVLTGMPHPPGGGWPLVSVRGIPRTDAA